MCPEVINPMSDGTQQFIDDGDPLLDRLLSIKDYLGGDFPRFLVFVNAYTDPDGLEKTLGRIPVEILPLIEEIATFHNFPKDPSTELFRRIQESAVRDKLKFYRNPRPYDYGDNLKNCFDYAIKKEFDYVVILRGDLGYDPKYLRSFLSTALESNAAAVIGQRIVSQEAAPRTWLDRFKWAANRVLSRIEEFALRMGLKDYHCGYRLLSTDVLKRVPYHLNAGDYLFDLQLLIQIRCLGIEITTVPVADFHDSYMRLGTMISYALRTAGTAIGYRLHQLHLLRRGNYFVDLGERYSLKRNRHSSHMQILDTLETGSTVLDLGCGRSLLAGEYAKRGITVIGVDSLPEDEVSPFLQTYVRHDLEEPLDLPFGRIFDYVILSDVIEHIKDRDSVMASLRRSLKPGGRLVISTGNVAIWFYRVSLLLGRFEYGPRGILDRTHVHLYTLDSFERFVQQNGYRLLEKGYTPIPFELVFRSTGRSATVETITRWYYKLCLVWPRLMAYQFIVHCTFSSYESASGEEMLLPADRIPASGKHESGD
jgi:SAM-dependent methyltransferase